MKMIRFQIVVQRAATMVQNIAKMDLDQPPYTEPVIRASEVIPQLNELLRTHAKSPVSWFNFYFIFDGIQLNYSLNCCCLMNLTFL